MDKFFDKDNFTVFETDGVILLTDFAVESDLPSPAGTKYEIYTQVIEDALAEPCDLSFAGGTKDAVRLGGEYYNLKLLKTVLKFVDPEYTMSRSTPRQRSHRALLFTAKNGLRRGCICSLVGDYKPVSAVGIGDRDLKFLRKYGL